ncbi:MULTISPECIES: CGNR zinc finger domain-containing protein [Nocardiaceae]|uniref:CGNR zinc finger domain-containing protein n=1 Tax=Nocardiaceae TaxID=85025 RepID=UPI001483B0BB|nr:MULTISPECIES: CGNR zinc finger domain-containing protein [Rhodococcus]
MLETTAVANDWSKAALKLWSQQTGQVDPQIRIEGGDLMQLRKVRAQCNSWLDGRTDTFDGAGESVSVGLAKDGVLHYHPTAGGARGLASLITLELLLAAQTGMLIRLKTCAAPECRVAFFDESRNSSRKWHDTRTCGNAANLKASRARRRLL